MKSKTKSAENAPGALQDMLMRFGVLGELLAFLWKRKLYWLLPLVITLLAFAILLVVGSSSPAGAFIYSLF